MRRIAGPESWVLLLLFVAGCAAPPTLDQQLEVSPSLTPAQVADLKTRARSPESFGIKPRSLWAGGYPSGIAEIVSKETVTVPLATGVLPSAGQSNDGSSRPVVFALVNGQPRVPVLIDTGSGSSLFGYSLARFLAIPPIAGQEAAGGYGIVGRLNGLPSLVPTMQMGALELRNLPALIGPDTHVLQAAAGVGRQGQFMVLGTDTLRRFSYLTLDYPRKQATFAPHARYAPDVARTVVTTVPFWWNRGHIFVDAVIDHRHRQACVIDTGMAAGMFVPDCRAERLGYSKSDSIVQPVQKELAFLNGAAGAALVGCYTIPHIQLGSASFSNVFAAGVIGATGPGCDPIMIGNSLLSSYRVTFDFRENRLWLER